MRKYGQTTNIRRPKSSITRHILKFFPAHCFCAPLVHFPEGLRRPVGGKDSIPPIAFRASYRIIEAKIDAKHGFYRYTGPFGRVPFYASYLYFLNEVEVFILYSPSPLPLNMYPFQWAWNFFPSGNFVLVCVCLVSVLVWYCWYFF